MRRALVSMGLVCLLAVAAVGAEFAVQSWMSFDLVSSGECTIGGETHRDSWFQNPYAWLVAEYSEGNWTLGLGTKFSPAGLCQVIAGARGVLGPFNFASYMEFGQEACGDEVCPGRFTPMKDQEAGSSSAEPRFVDWKFLAWTTFAGVDFWAVGGIDTVNAVSKEFSRARLAPMGDCNGDCPLTSTSRFGYAVGAHGEAGDLEIWVEAEFGCDGIAGVLSRGVDMDRIASTMYYCDWFHIGGTCDSTFTGLDLRATFPFGCANIAASLFIGCTGFESVTFGVNDIQLGSSWVWIDDLDIRFQTAKKDWRIDLELVVPEVLCIQPYFGWDFDLDNNTWDQTSVVIDSFKFVGLKMETTWNGVTFRAVERLDSGFATITTDARLWWISQSEEHCFEDEPFDDGGCTQVCLQDTDVDEAFAIEVDGDACCGGALFGGLYVFFNHDLKDESLFDWYETRAVVKMGIGPSFDVGMEACFNYERRSPVFSFTVAYTWGKLRLFEWPWFFDCFSCAEKTLN